VNANLPPFEQFLALAATKMFKRSRGTAAISLVEQLNAREAAGV
jgi:hypothetical protein